MAAQHRQRLVEHQQGDRPDLHARHGRSGGYVAGDRQRDRRRGNGLGDQRPHRRSALRSARQHRGLHDHRDRAQTGRGIERRGRHLESGCESYSYQWQRNSGSGWVNIAGATGNSYTPGTADLGVHLQVQVTGHNAYGTATVTASISGTVASGAPVNAVPPTISGSATLGAKLSVSTSTWSPTGTPSYQWLRCTSPSSCSAISGATAASYVAAQADVGDSLELVVTMTNTYGHTSVTTAPTATVAS